MNELTKREKEELLKKIEKNKKLVRKYPWLKPLNRISLEPIEGYDYSFTEWDSIEKGWDIAFGKMLLKELGEVIDKNGLKNEFHILEIKEKYGELRISCMNACEDIDKIIEKYRVISRNVCMGCGKPDVPMTNYGWYYPVCKECWNNFSNKSSRLTYEECVDMEKSQIPDSFEYKDETIEIKDVADVLRKRYANKEKKQKES